jgi:hypothetical protein
MNTREVSHPDPRIRRAGCKYAAAILNHTNPCRGDGNMKEQVQRFVESVERYQLMSRRVREVLLEYGIPVAFHLVYRNFANRVLKVKDKFELLTRHIQILEAEQRAVMYGCDRQVLERICRDVLDYDVEKMAAELNYGP